MLDMLFLSLPGAQPSRHPAWDLASTGGGAKKQEPWRNHPVQVHVLVMAGGGEASSVNGHGRRVFVCLVLSVSLVLVWLWHTSFLPIF